MVLEALGASWGCVRYNDFRLQNPALLRFAAAFGTVSSLDKNFIFDSFSLTFIFPIIRLTETLTVTLYASVSFWGLIRLRAGVRSRASLFVGSSLDWRRAGWS